MEAAAIGAANTALNSVVKTTITTIRNEIGLLLGVQEELFFIKEELEMMQGFLQAASTEKEKGIVVSIWVKQVKELAFDVEDCLQEASVHLRWHLEKSYLPIMCSVMKRDQIAKKIRMLKIRIEDVSKRNLRYELIKGNGGPKKDESASDRSIANVEAFLVGLDEPERKLVDLILKENGEQDVPGKGKVISVVGMGGLGKTTLVRKVYHCLEQKEEFSHFAWVTVQHPFNKQEFLETLANQILVKKKPSKEVDDEGGQTEGHTKKFEEVSKKTIKESLENNVIKTLQDRKYLIVLDDLCTMSEWKMIEPVLSMGKGSRIIVTTRHIKPLAEYISHKNENIYEIKELSEDDALDLFFKAVYKTDNYHLLSDEGPISTETTEGDGKAHKQCITNSITEEKDREIKEEPRHKNKCDMKNGSISNEITEESSELQKQFITKGMKIKAGLIIKSCGRLPLAIVTIGSYLATKTKSSVEWKAMHEHLSSELAKNRNLGEVQTVLTSSYDGMPYHLKPSLLYLSVFHNHKEIRRSRIIRRWMGDGYVMADRKRTAEDVGKDYFYDLMGRNLIQPSQVSTIISGDIKRCNIHDMMYELILAKAEEENLVSVLEDKNLITMTDKMRHLVIAGGSCTGDKVLKRVKLFHMRSLSIFGEVGDYLKYSRMKLLRVLDLEGCINLNDRDLRSIGKLRHLKYLGLRGTKIRKLPTSLGKLSELETLDIRNTDIVRLPKGLTKLHKLSYLRAGSDHIIDFPRPIWDFYYDHIYSIACEDSQDNICCEEKGKNSVSHGVRCFCCLCITFLMFPCFILEDKDRDNFSGGVWVPQGIGKLRSLNTFGVIDIGGSKSLAKEIKNLTNLRKLAVSGFTKDNGKTLAEVIDELKHLRSLVLKDADYSGLKCCLESVFSPPKDLQSLKLDGRIGKLPNWISSLENLEKIHLKRTYLTEDIEVIGKLQPNVKILYLLDHSFEKNMKKLCFGKGTFPILQVVILEELDYVESVSIERTALERLELLKIRKGGLKSVSGLKFLVQLKEMELVGYSGESESDREFVRNIQEQLKKLTNKPVLRVIEK